MPFFNVMPCTVTASPFYTAMDDPGTVAGVTILQKEIYLKQTGEKYALHPPIPRLDAIPF